MGKRLFAEAGLGTRVTGLDMLISFPDMDNWPPFRFWGNVQARAGFVLNRDWTVELGITHSSTSKLNTMLGYEPTLKTGVKTVSYDLLFRKYRTSNGAIAPVGPYKIYGISYTNASYLVNGIPQYKASAPNVVFGKGYVKFLSNTLYLNLGYQLKLPTTLFLGTFSNRFYGYTAEEYMSMQGILLHNSYAFLRAGYMIF